MDSRDELVMGFDFGQSKIGVAIGQRLTSSANPLGIVPAKDGKPDWQILDKLINEWQPGLFIVGLPLNMDDSMSEMGRAAQKFSRRLEGRYHIATAMMDERLSTFEARQQTDNVSAAGSGKHTQELDDIAAQLILESWLRSQ